MMNDNTHFISYICNFNNNYLITTSNTNVLSTGQIFYIIQLCCQQVEVVLVFLEFVLQVVLRLY